jgi:hypothetical protein
MPLYPLLSLSLALTGCREPEPDKQTADTSMPPETGSPTETGVQPDTSDGTDSADSDTDPPPLLSVSFTSPSDRSGFYFDEPETLAGLVVHPDGGDLSEAVVSLVSSVDGDISFGFDLSTGAVTATGALSPGNHVLTLTAGIGGRDSYATLHLGVCEELVEDFADDLDPAVWSVYENAQWDSGGFLEMTGDMPDRSGKIFNTSYTVQPNYLQASFKIYTGPNTSTGGDGFSFYIVNAPDLAALAEVLKCSGGIGNDYSTALADCAMAEADLAAVDSFSVEFDTYGNGAGCGNANASVDPVCTDHIAICTDGSPMPFNWTEDLFGQPEDAPFWADVGELEDSAWHDVEITLDGSTAMVALDGSAIIDTSIPAFSFKGGFFGFTARTGAATNHHRFDDIRIRTSCGYMEE